MSVIGNDVWIGYKAVIMPGVQIGDGAIIAAMSLVTKDVEPYTIVGGNPAKTLRQRFPDETIKLLLEIAWWNWDIEKITRNLESIVGMDIEALRRCV
jgi:virginiamycin A acetyltransferase